MTKSLKHNRSHLIGVVFAGWLACAVAGILGSGNANAQTLEQRLRNESASALAAAAERDGDAGRGAIVFHQAHIACSKCHQLSTGEGSLGPNLTQLDKTVSAVSLVESVLEPSKVIGEKYRTATLVTEDGSVVSGLLASQDAKTVSIRDASRNGETRVFDRDSLADFKLLSTSLMPEGQVNQLASRQQFLDLIRYLMELRDGGLASAKRLQPPPSLTALKVPEYEQNIDHSGFIQQWDDAAFKRGEAIYQRVCANCHGTKDRLGSLPTSLRFASGKFKNGSDPLSMYRTLTYGFGQMTPQTWMVPSQKYDVIHYIRREYLEKDNPSQHFSVDADWLAGLPKGSERGPEPVKLEPWSTMDYGPALTHSYEVPGPKENIAYKGMAIRLDQGTGGVSRGRYWTLWDSDTMRMSAIWTSQEGSDTNFINWQGIQFNGAHGIHPSIVGRTLYANASGPGWGRPSSIGNEQSDRFVDDQRVLGRDGRRYGPLPSPWARYLGCYRYGTTTILKYLVDGCEILESPRILESATTATSALTPGVTPQPRELADSSVAPPLIVRLFRLGPHDRDLEMRVCDLDSPALDGKAAIDTGNLKFAGIFPNDIPHQFVVHEGSLRVRFPASNNQANVALWMVADDSHATHDPNLLQRQLTSQLRPEDLDLDRLVRGGPPQWPESLTTHLLIGAEDGPFAVDRMEAPQPNPWLAQTRFTGLDFFEDGSMAVCTWDGDVWKVKPIPDAEGTQLAWRRIASGLFQPLGVKVIDGRVHLTCRDQLVVLNDLNDDGETDFYQCLNNDHQVTTHFHEFAMGLQIDDEGNFYYAKSGCHGLKAIVPHHGTLLRVSRDGSKTDILATGFRAANGVCLNPDGSFFVTDQEGFWNPKNRINWVTLRADGRPNFYGNMWGYHDVTDESDAAMEQPVCWITNAFDRSPAELLWVNSDRWGELNGSLLNLSYGYGRIYLVLHERIGDQMQGGMIAMPIPDFPTGVMRGRFSQRDGHLYLCGMFAWAGNATEPGGLYRMRRTSLPVHLPCKMKAEGDRIELEFTQPLARDTVSKGNIQVKTWALKRTANYGSKHYDEKPLPLDSIELLSDGRRVVFRSKELKPTWCMEIQFNFTSQQGDPVEGTIHNTIHRLR